MFVWKCRVGHRFRRWRGYWRVGDPNSIDLHRASDVFEVLVAQVVESHIEAVADVIAHGARYADPAGFGESLQSGSNIHPVAVDVAVLDDDVAEIDAHTEYDPLFLANAVIAIRHPALDRDGTGDRSEEHTSELQSH